VTQSGDAVAVLSGSWRNWRDFVAIAFRIQ